MLLGRYNIKNIIIKYRVEKKMLIIKFKERNSRKRANQTKIMRIIPIILITIIIIQIIKVTHALIIKILPSY